MTDLDNILEQTQNMAAQVRDGLTAIDNEVAAIDERRSGLLARRAAFLAALHPLRALLTGTDGEPATGHQAVPVMPAAPAPVTVANAAPVTLITNVTTAAEPPPDATQPRRVHTGGRRPDPDSIAGKVRAWAAGRASGFTLDDAAAAFPDIGRGYLSSRLTKNPDITVIGPGAYRYKHNDADAEPAAAPPATEDITPFEPTPKRQGREPDPNSLAGQIRAWAADQTGTFTLDQMAAAFPGTVKSYMRTVLARVTEIEQCGTDAYRRRGDIMPPVQSVTARESGRRRDFRTWALSQPASGFTAADACMAFDSCGNGWVGVRLGELTREGTLRRLPDGSYQAAVARIGLPADEVAA